MICCFGWAFLTRPEIVSTLSRPPCAAGGIWVNSIEGEEFALPDWQLLSPIERSNSRNHFRETGIGRRSCTRANHARSGWIGGNLYAWCIGMAVRLTARTGWNQSNFRLNQPDLRRLVSYRRSSEGSIDRYEARDMTDFSLSAILTSSGNDLACIFFITWLRCIFTVASLAPISPATCLFSMPETTRFITSRSRMLNQLYRCRSSAVLRCFSRTIRSLASDRCTASRRS